MGCCSASGGADTFRECGSSGYLDVDAAIYVSTDVTSGVTCVGDTGKSPFDIDLVHEGVDSTKSSLCAVKSVCSCGHCTSDRDRITGV